MIIRCKDIETAKGVSASTAKRWRKRVREYLSLAASEHISKEMWNSAANDINKAWVL